MGDDRELLVLYRGTVGQEEGVAAVVVVVCGKTGGGNATTGEGVGSALAVTPSSMSFSFVGVEILQHKMTMQRTHSQKPCLAHR